LLSTRERGLTGGASLVGFLAAEGGLALLTAAAAPGLQLAFGFLAALGGSAVAAFCLQRLLSALAGRRTPATYRLALILGIGLSAAVCAAASTPAALGWFGVAVVSGSVVGSLAASWRDDGLWEDNSPPTAEVTRFVFEAHAARGVTPRRSPRGKRLFDLVAATAGLVILFPLAAGICLVLWFEDPGPLFFVKNSVGSGGRNFRQWKLRTMVRGAETESGPVWSEEEDQRVLRVGGLLRKTALDELPQLVNIFVGQMSVVGPRPQRTVLVAETLRRIPAYAERHRLAPGLAGLAQVAGHYYITPRQKLRFDMLYLEHAGLGFDVKLVAIAFAIVFFLRWRPGWNGRAPRAWLHGRRRATGAAAAAPSA
jgi:lipopolysaccharide/colanic/teichoic acid biosynthesis glycosyltransferase